MKKLMMMMMIASIPLAGIAQSKAVINFTIIDKTVKPRNDFYKFTTFR